MAHSAIAASVQRNTAAPVGININARVSALRTTIKSGETIRAVDINELIALVNIALGHYHSYYDLAQLATFGTQDDRGNHDRATYESTKDTSVSGTLGGTVGAISAGVTITASKHNELANPIRRISSHTHGFTDEYNRTISV
jgi:hypothetical protein